MSTPALRLWLLWLLLSFFWLNVVNVTKELGKVEVLLLDITALQFVNIVDDSVEV